MFRLPRIRSRRSRGQSVVELALVMPLLLLLFAGAADLGQIFFNFVSVENAVKEGALYGSRYPLCDNASSLCPDPNNVQWRTENEARTAAGTALVTPTSECRNAITQVAYGDLRDCVAGDTYVVRATIQFRPLTPIIGQLIGGTIDLTSESRAIVLNQAFDPTPGLAPTKLVLGTGARNAAELAANCEQPDPIGSPSYFRSPCVDIVAPIGADIQAVFRPGDPISYKATVRNNGGTNVSGVTIADSQGWPATSGSCPSRPTSMAVKTSYTCTYTRAAPNVTGTGATSNYENRLTADSAETIPTVDAAIVTVERPPADLQVLKFINVYEKGGTGDGPLFGTSGAETIYINAQVPTASVWYKIAVTNAGGQPATALTITDSNGALPTNANCPARPATLAAGTSWICIYKQSFNSTQVHNNTVTAASPDSPPDADDSRTATVTVAQCTGASRVIPSTIGSNKAAAQAQWQAAGFTPANLTVWSGNNAALTKTQSRTAFTCVAANSTMTITR